MTENKDEQIFEHKDILINCLQIENKNEQNIYDIAKAKDFIGLLYFLCEETKININELIKDP